MDPGFGREAEWVASALLSARLEQAALRRLLLKKKIIQPEEFLTEINALASDDYVYSIRRLAAESEWQLRNGRWHIGGAEATDALARQLALGPNDSVLDIGCGVGGATRQIAERFGSSLIGVDHRFDRIVEATFRTAALGLTARVAFQVGDAEALPFEDDVFDAVISQAALNWIPDKTAAAREAFRVLKRGGRLGFECEAMTERRVGGGEEDPSGLFRILAWQQLLGATGFVEISVQEMWNESREFYPSGPEREQIDRGERVNVRIVTHRP